MNAEKLIFLSAFLAPAGGCGLVLLALLMVGGLLRTYEFSECEDLCLDLRLDLG